ncbi:MAG: TolC family protein [Nitrospirota bacterium]
MQIRINKIILVIFFILTSFSNTLAQEEYSLDDLYRIALERAEEIKISEEDLYIAERGKDKALSVLLPRLSAFGNYTRYSESKISGSGWTIQPDWSELWGLRLDQSLSLSGRELTAFNISKENIEKSRYDLYAVREDYLLRVSAAYYDVLRAKKAVEIARANVERLTKHRDAARTRVRVGEVTKTTLLRAEAELSGAQSEEIKAKNGLEFVKAVLARIVGIDKAYEVKESRVKSQESEEIKDLQLPTLDLLKQLALSERVEMKSLELQRQISEEQVRYTRGAYWPTLSIEGIYSKKDEDPASPFLNKESVYGGLKLNFPFFEGGLTKAEVQEAEARQRQIELIFEDLKKTINIEVENAYLDLKTQEGVLKSFEDQLIFARDNYNAISKQFEYGLADSIDVMDANTLFVTAERQLSDARYNYQLAILRLKRATGTLLKTVISQQSTVVSQKIEGE